MSEQVQVIVLNDSRRIEGCEAACGIDWSDPEALAMAAGQVRDKFGEEIQIAFADLSEDGINPDLEKWSRLATAKSLSFPLLLLNDQVRIAGNFDIRQLLDVIEVEVELGV
ncbi:MAG: hypothetical protein V3S02_03935 [Dehalococcoidales bacterium]